MVETCEFDWQRKDRGILRAHGFGLRLKQRVPSKIASVPKDVEVWEQTVVILEHSICLLRLVICRASSFVAQHCECIGDLHTRCFSPVSLVLLFHLLEIFLISATVGVMAKCKLSISLADICCCRIWLHLEKIIQASPSHAQNIFEC